MSISFEHSNIRIKYFNSLPPCFLWGRTELGGSITSLKPEPYLLTKWRPDLGALVVLFKHLVRYIKLEAEIFEIFENVQIYSGYPFKYQKHSKSGHFASVLPVFKWLGTFDHHLTIST